LSPSSEVAPVSLIVAMDRQRVIGSDGRLPWHLPADLQRFKSLTMGHHIIMGRKTWESIGRPLPGRVSVVVTRNRDYVPSGALRAASLPEALALASADSEPFVIGGGQLFREALPWTGRLYLTEVLADFPGDAWFPELPADEWKEMHCEHHPAAGQQPAWDFRIYERATAWRKPRC
jgi:dihydrofolate reductase